MRQAVPLEESYRLLNHGPTTLISSKADGKENVMAAAWVMPLDFKPARLAAVIARETYTRELVQASGVMVVQIPVHAQIKHLYAAGRFSGRTVNKIERLGFQTSAASLVDVPLIEGCAGWLECKLLPEQPLAEPQDLFVAEVVAAWADDEIYEQGRWKSVDDSKKTLHHIAGGAFFVTGNQVLATGK